MALEKIGTILLSIATIEEFRATVYAEVDLRFDGETNVLLRTLLDIPFADTRVTSAMTSMRMLLETFDGIEGRCYHPHLFIPMYDRHKQEGSLGQGRPVMMVYLSEEELSAGTGQQFDDSGALVPIEDVDEEFAKTKEVWVLAINERVDEKGDVLEPVTKLNSCEAGEVGGDDPDPIIGVVLNKIAIKEHKESWLAGGSEIHILGFRTFWNGLYPSGAAAYNEGLAFSGPANEGPQILWVSRGDVDAHVEHIVNFPIVNNWHIDSFYQDAILVGYVIFEYDSWPAGIKARTINLVNTTGTTFHNIFYRSSNHSYTHGRWMGNTLNGAYGPSVYNYGMSDSRIAFNLCWEHQ